MKKKNRLDFTLQFSLFAETTQVRVGKNAIEAKGPTEGLQEILDNRTFSHLRELIPYRFYKVVDRDS